MNCAACNAELKVGASQCLECGKPVEASAGTAAPSRERTFGGWVNLAVRIIKMEEPAIQEAARDPNATTMAVAFIAIAAVAPVVGSLGALLLVLPFSLVATLVGIGVVHVFATLLGGKGEFQGLLRVQGLSQLLGWFSAVPILGAMLSPVFALYAIVVWVNNVSKVHKLPIPHSIAAVVLPLVVICGMCFAVLFAFGASLALLGAAK